MMLLISRQTRASFWRLSKSLMVVLWLTGTAHLAAQTVPSPPPRPLRSFTSGGLTNKAEVIRLLSKGITNLEQQVSNPLLDARTREELETTLEKRRKMLAIYRTNDSAFRVLAEAAALKAQDGSFGRPLPSGFTNSSGRLPARPQRASTQPFGLPPQAVTPFTPPSLAALEEAIRSRSEAIRLPPLLVPTNNVPDFAEHTLTRWIQKYERELTNTNLSPGMRQNREILLDDLRKQRANLKNQ